MSMATKLLFAGVFAVMVGGCATSAETERRAQEHDARARAAASYQDYDRAAQEKHEADRLHNKAAQERLEEKGTVPPGAPPDYRSPPARPTPAAP
jgi:hypothetical protein